ncbi:MAG: O-antigen ligase family protein [Rhodospirillales bacterium]|nr:O-antigen ligase family protein [Rhodospirillales bacterium]
MRLNFITILAHAAFYLSLIRATSIALFLPANEHLLSTISYTQQTVTNYILLLLLTGYLFLLNDYRFVQVFLRTPLLLLFTVGTILSIAFSVDIMESVKFVLTVIVISFPAVIFSLRYGPQKMFYHFAGFLLVMVFANLIYILVMPQYAIMTHAHNGRWKGLFEHKNMFGPFFAIGFFILLHWLREAKTVLWLRILLGISVITSFVFVIKSGSATALVCFATLLIFYPTFLVTFRLRPMERLAAYLGISSLLLLIYVLFGDLISDEIFKLTGRDATLTGRTGIWEVLMGAVWDRPVLGYGAGMAQRPEFMARFQAAIGWPASSAHNSFIDLFLNFGIPLACVITYVIFKIFFSSLLRLYHTPESKGYAALACSLLMVVIANSFASSGALVGRSIFWMFMVIGFILLLVPSKNTEK